MKAESPSASRPNFPGAVSGRGGPDWQQVLLGLLGYPRPARSADLASQRVNYSTWLLNMSSTIAVISHDKILKDLIYQTAGESPPRKFTVIDTLGIRDPVAVVSRFTKRRSEKAAILLIVSGESPYVVQELGRLKVCAIIHRRDGLKVLVAAISSCALDQRYVSQKMRNLMARARKIWSKYDRYLTPRQHHVFIEFAKGMTDEEIARRIERAQKTVTDHRKRLMRNLGVTNQAQLLRLAVLLGYPIVR